MIFVDASALIAIIAEEADADVFADMLDDDPERISSAVAIWETVAGPCRSYAFSVLSAREHAARFLEVGGFRPVAIGSPELELAPEAYGRFGKGRHPAALNLGDCFAYACAKSHGARLPYKGNDLAKTDLA